MTMENIGYKVMLALGIIFTLAGIKMLRESRKISRWPSTTGHLESATVKESQEAVDPNAKYELKVLYSYTVNNQEYRSDKYQSYKIYEMKDYAEKRRSKISQDPKVYYNPDNPAEAFLSPGSAFLPWFVIGLGLSTGFFGMMALNFA